MLTQGLVIDQSEIDEDAGGGTSATSTFVTAIARRIAAHVGDRILVDAACTITSTKGTDEFDFRISVTLPDGTVQNFLGITGTGKVKVGLPALALLDATLDGQYIVRSQFNLSAGTGTVTISNNLLRTVVFHPVESP